MRPTGLLSIKEFRNDSGDIVPVSRALDLGLVLNPKKTPAGWGADRDEICIGYNLFTDGGRQALAKAFGNASPITDYLPTEFGVGTGTTAAAVTDTALQASVFQTTISGVDFPSPFIARVEMTLGVGDANGYLLTEFGLFTDAGTLLARKVNTGINKQSGYAPTLFWKIRF